MVRLRKTPQLKEKLHRLVGTSKSDQLGNELPLKLLEAVQAHLDDEQQADWVHHSLLVKVAKWNRSRERTSITFGKYTACSLNATRAEPLPEYSLRALIRGSEVYIEPVVPKARVRSLRPGCYAAVLTVSVAVP